MELEFAVPEGGLVVSCARLVADELAAAVVPLPDGGGGVAAAVVVALPSEGGGVVEVGVLGSVATLLAAALAAALAPALPGSEVGGGLVVGVVGVEPAPAWLIAAALAAALLPEGGGLDTVVGVVGSCAMAHSKPIHVPFAALYNRELNKP